MLPPQYKRIMSNNVFTTFDFIYDGNSFRMVNSSSYVNLLMHIPVFGYDVIG